MSARGLADATTKRAFSLMEIMVAGAMVTLLGAGALSLMSFLHSQSRLETSRALAVADAQTTIDRVFGIASITSAYASSTALCEALEAAGGPLDTTTGAVATGTCPNVTVSGVPVASSTMLKTVAISTVTVDAGSAQQVVVTINGGGLRSSVVLRTLVSL